MVSLSKRASAAKSPGSGTRRPHRKSRNGCVQCKQRHMKCDEQRPVCANCSTGDRTCSFHDQLPQRPIQAFTGSDSFSDAPAVSTASVGSSPASFGAVIGAAVLGLNSINGTGSQTESLSSRGYELAHLALLHHLETQVLKPDVAGLPDGVDTGPLLDVLFQAAISEPYLMDELLAMSALHLSTLTSDAAEKQRYHHQAAQLQTRALTLFNSARPAVTDDNCISMFLFSGILGLHALFDTTSFHRDFTEFLDKFIQFLSLHRGIRTITRHSWHILSQSELRHVVNLMSNLDQQDTPPMGSGTECDALMADLEASRESLGPASFNACHEAVEWLQWVAKQRRGLPGPLQMHAAMAWPVLISFDYLQMLRQRRPEALVILAHWAVFLHYERRFWVFGDSGRFLMQSISKYLGAYWDDWMAWPRQTLEDEGA